MVEPLCSTFRVIKANFRLSEVFKEFYGSVVSMPIEWKNILLFLSRLMTKPKMACAPSKDSDQPGHPPSLIRIFAACMKKACVLSYPLSAQRRLWSDWEDAQADLSLHWVHMSFCWFCHEAAHFLPVQCLLTPLCLVYSSLLAMIIFIFIIWATSQENLSFGGFRPGKTQTGLLSYTMPNIPLPLQTVQTQIRCCRMLHATDKDYTVCSILEKSL